MKKLHELIPSPRATKRFVNVYRLIRAAVDIDEGLELDDFIGDDQRGQYRAALLLLAILTGYPDQATELLRDLSEEEHPETWWEFIAASKQRVKERTSHPAGPSPATNGQGTAEHAAPSRSGAETGKTDRETPGLPKEKEQGKNGFGSDALKEDEAERWEQLFAKLEPLRSEIAATEPCRDYVTWAPKVARYSFQSGRILFARNTQPRQNKTIAFSNPASGANERKPA